MALFSSEIRRRWRRAVIGLVLGVGAGATLAAAAGARRTDTAYPRMIEATNAGDLFVSSFDEDAGGRAALYAEVAALDGVERTGGIVGVNLVPMAVPRGSGTTIEACSNLSSDGKYGYSVDRPNLLAGRLPAPDRADEILVSEHYADTFGVGVGDELDLVRTAGAPTAGEVTAADGPVSHVRIVGVGVLASQVVPVSDLDAAPRIMGTPAFVERYAPDQSAQCYDGISVDLAPGADANRITEQIDRIGSRGAGVLVQGRGSDADVRRAIQPQVTALYLFAIVAGLATMLVTAQLIGREHQQAAAIDAHTWRSLGMTRRQVRSLVAAPSALTAAVGALVTFAIAVAASSRFPIGPARLAEPDRGTELHLAIDLGGALAALTIGAAIAALAAAMALRPRSADTRLGRTSRVIGATSSPSVALGMHLATGARRGGAPLPIRSAAAGAAIAMAAIATTVTLAGGLDDLVSNPSRYGQDWDVMVDGVFGPAPAGPLLDAFEDSEAVEAVAGGRHGEVTLDGQRVGTVAFADLVGATFPAIIEGRAPEGDEEIVLGSRTLRDLGHALNDQVAMDAGEGPRQMTVVGRAAFPRLNRGAFNTLGMGVGAIVRREAFPPFDVDGLGLPPDTDLSAFEDRNGEMYEMIAIRLRAGATDDERNSVVATPRSIVEGLDIPVRTEQRPIAIDSYAAVRSTPAVLVVLLGAMAAATLAHLVMSVVWRRRRDLAVCSALGMRRRQLLSAVAIQALLIALVSLIGLPIGVAAGRVAWQGFVHDVGVSDSIRLPVAEIAAVPLVLVALAVAVATLLAAVTSRTSSVSALRAD